VAPSIVQVSEASDARLDDYRELKDAARRREGTFIAESELVIRRLLNSRFGVHSLIFTPQRYARMENELADLESDITVFVGSEALLGELVGFPLHRGALGLGVRTDDPDLTSLLSTSQTLVIAEGVGDPDNIGAIFRHSAAFGVGAVLLSPSCGDPLYRKAVRSSMGWSLHLPWRRLTDSEWPSVLDDLRADGWHTLALTPSESAPLLPRILGAFGAREKIALLLGTEHEGLTDIAMRKASTLARIPMSNGVDSLNVATTAAISLYEMARRSW
jgi:tRNA G18 (ribose-2'-O)-methylase SpoU